MLGLDLGAAEAALAAPRGGDLAHALEAVFAAQPRDAVLDALLAAGVPATPALRGAEVWESEHLRANDFTEGWTHPRLGPVAGIRSFFDFSRTPAGYSHPAPDLGQDTRALLAEAGLSPERIEALFAEGAVFEPERTLTAAQ